MKLGKFVTRLGSWILGRPGPYAVYMEPTLRCNFRCVFCPVWRTNPYPEEASGEVFNHLLDDAWMRGARVISIIGGEPLLHRDIAEIATHAVDIGYYTQIVTNGLLLHRHFSERWLRDIDILAVSFTLWEKEFNETRGTTHFETVKSNIERAHSIGCKVRLLDAVGPETLPMAEATAEYAEHLGVPLHLSSIVPEPREGYPKAEWVGAKNFIERMVKLKRDYPHTVKYTDTLDKMRLDGGFNKHIPCRAGEVVCSMKPDGSIVYPCPAYPKANMMDLANPTPEEVKSCAKWSALSGKAAFCDGCQLGCMYPTGMMGHPMQTLRWIFDNI